jgi:hypothetical protein
MIEFTTAEKVYMIGALEMTIQRTTEFLKETEAKGMSSDVTEFALRIYQSALDKLRGDIQ